ncbi:phage tail protein [Pseudocitrobacter vendiensis]|uniref:Phage tail fibre protein N-terminal domain-containing protein n=1 Tax=Pseudocitrobacter vendiensis TaxID=2488306 RepID=A0ABM9FCT3_9ENTR|nr:phage tail protein [Pseudocitrobacter vendiensis]CAH6661001.1 hypothetical protein FBBNIHIM_17990 [Pseudocitrobacter vendiensis]
MSQTAITLAFEQWKAQQAATGESVLLDEFVFALVPGLDPDLPVDRSETLPPAAQIVHRESVTRKGVVNENAVVHSAVLGADVGDFSFNWIGLTNKASGTLAMIVHAPEQQKLKTKEGQQGNVLTRSFLMEFAGAQAETAINTPAETWQIDFTARMAGMDERQRLENIDIYGAGAFFDNGYLVAKSGDQYFVTKGTGYVAGLRSVLAANQNITVTTKPVKVWLDVCWSGALTSVWAVQSKVTVAANLVDYEQSGVKHYVFALASIDANGNITDLRPKGTLDNQQANSSYLVKSKNLSDLADSAKSRDNLGLGSGATANIVTSLTDATPKRIPVVGWMGLGATADTAAGTMGSITVTQFDYFDPADNVGAFPGEWSGGLSFANSGATGWQMVGLSRGAVPRFRFRTKANASAFSGWVEMYHTGNKPSASDTGALAIANNLSDVASTSASRNNLGLKSAAVLDVGTTAGTVAAGNDSRIVNALQKSNNLSDLTNTATARNNLGLGSAATYAAGKSSGQIPAMETAGLGGWGLGVNSDNGVTGTPNAVGVNRFAWFLPSENSGPYAGAWTVGACFGSSGVFGWQLMGKSNTDTPAVAVRSRTASGGGFTPWYPVVLGMRCGAVSQMATSNVSTGQIKTYDVPEGHFLSGIVQSSNNQYITVNAIRYRPVQQLVNGSWITLAS